MTMMGRAVRAAMLGLLLPAAAWAQATQADIDALQAQVTTVSQRIDRLRETDAAKATTLSKDLDLVRDDVAYLRVRLRREP